MAGFQGCGGVEKNGVGGSAGAEADGRGKGGGGEGGR